MTANRSPYRRRRTWTSSAYLLILLLIAGRPNDAIGADGASLQERDHVPSIEEMTRGMRRLQGFFNLYWDDAEGKLYWEIDRWNEAFLYQVSLTTGLGSNPVGLDRGQLGGTYVLEARRVGPRVLLVEPNYRYRALSSNPGEVRAVAEAFAPSTRWGFEVVAQSAGRALVDATEFFLRDAHGVARQLAEAEQGHFDLDESRSAIYLPRTKSFPLNTEVEAWLTFTSDEPGPLVRATAASGDAVTLRQHHSLVQLPDDGYRPRRADPRVGAYGISFHDYATPIDEPLEVRWVARHRLRKQDPSASRSIPVEPIIYYLDPGVPEPIRGALIEGASWWNDAFEAAGFIDAFRVEMLPEGADPMDLRYNIIHWTHRSTRGWSYGSTVIDPRTGEILKGNVNLGSLRLRQDHMIGEGLVTPYNAALGYCDLADGPTFDYLAQVTEEVDPVEMALARIRQLAAHEVGHTLGLAHNYIASTYGRASVMDYPAPLVTISDEGELDLSDAYGIGVGEYDRFAIRWLYSEYPPEADEQEQLEAMVQEALNGGLRFLTDQDARPAGAAHPLAALWDNGSDPIATLEHEIEVRRIGLSRFGSGAVREGDPLASLEQVLVPLYFHHRYQVEATAHSIGGADYSFALRGDGQEPIRIVPAIRQRRALDALLLTVEPEFLVLPDSVIEAIPPPAFGMGDREVFEGWTGPVFDPLAAAAASADMTFEFILQPQRMARLTTFHARDETYPGLAEVIERTLEVTWYAEPQESARLQAVRETVEGVLLDRLIREGSRDDAPPLVRAVIAGELSELAGWLEGRSTPTPYQRLALTDIQRWLDRDHDPNEWGPAPEAPPGSPIGGPRSH